MSLTYSLCCLKETNKRINGVSWFGVEKRSYMFSRHIHLKFLGASQRTNLNHKFKFHLFFVWLFPQQEHLLKNYDMLANLRLQNEIFQVLAQLSPFKYFHPLLSKFEPCFLVICRENEQNVKKKFVHFFAEIKNLQLLFMSHDGKIILPNFTG